MKLDLIFQISKALLFARWKQTLIAAIGVTFSITMFITLLGFMAGLNDLLDGLMMNRTAHVRLYKEMEISAVQPIAYSAKYKDYYNFVESTKPKKGLINIYNANAIIESLEKDSRILGIAPKVSAQVFYNSGVVNLNGLINGIEVEAEKELFAFDDYIIAGNYLDLKNISNSIIIGTGVAEKISAQLGDVIQITNPQGKIVKLKVVGFFQTGVADIDKVQSYCSIETTQKILGEAKSYITDIQIKLKNILLAPVLSEEYAKLYKVEAIDIQRANAQFETGSSIRTLISYAVGITLLIVSGFGIYNILNMLIYEKMDSIAILKATGFSGKDVSRIFITVALTIGIAGGSLGLLLGFGLCNLIDIIPFNTDALPTIKTYPINYDLSYYLIAGIFSILTTYFAGYFPAKKASKVDPVEIIRGK
jgi:lipoprotein-releasing system permease protein